MERIEKFLKERKNNNFLRSLRRGITRSGSVINYNGKDYVDFSSNDYLGLSHHPKLLGAAKDSIDSFGVSSSGSRLLCGDLEIFHQLEEKIASFKKKESALVFNTGFQANVGIISAFCKKGDVVFSDKLCHASIIDGVQLSGVKHIRFRHNDVDHLKDLLIKERDNFQLTPVYLNSLNTQFLNQMRRSFSLFNWY